MSKLWFKMAMLGVEAQQVMWLRSMRIAKGGKRGKREADRMVTEKVLAAGQAAAKLSGGAGTGAVLSLYRRKVRANARRLSR